MQRIPLLPHVQSRQCPPGAADRIERAPLAALEKPRFTKRLLDQLLGFLERLFRQVLKGKTAERQRDAGLHAVTANVGQLERATTEVTHDSIRPMEARDDSERGQLRLALAGDHLNPGATD